MTRTTRSFARLFFGALSASVALALTGCGVGAPAAPGTYTVPSVIGSVYGGNAPIWHGRVRMYITNNGGYGAAATEIAATSDSGGSGGIYTSQTGAFSIDNVTYPYTCTANQFAYITVTGGDAGSGAGAATPTANPNSVQLVMLGNCSNLSTQSAQSATRVFMSEASTVVSAYALSNFISEDPSHLGDGDQRVWINAPATNNDPTGTCTVTSGVTSSCTGAGLAHAVANAMNLVNSVAYGTGYPTGSIYSVLPTNASASVPQALIYSLADIDAACVNSNGGSATDATTNDGTTCGKLFSYTTLPGTFSTPTSLPLVPTDSLMAMVNLAKHPYGSSSSAVTGLFNLITPQTAFAPALSAKPFDWSIGIVYPASTVASTPTMFTGSNTVALDPAGNVYVSDNINTSGTANKVISIAANGTGRWVATSATTLYDGQQLATDTNGNVWLANDGTTAATAQILCYKQADGSSCTSITQSATPYPYYAYAISVDRSNNLWYGCATTNASYYQLWRANSGATTGTAISGKQSQNVESLAFDTNQNLWVGYYSSTNANSKSAYVPKTASGWGTYTEFTLPQTTAATPANTYYVKGVVVDSSNRPVFTAKSAFATVTPSFDSNGYVSGITSQSSLPVGGATPTWSAIDGENMNWYGGGSVTIYATVNGTGNIHGSSSAQGLQPCQLVNGATTCASTLSGASGLAIDDAGTLWMAYGTASKSGVIQVIGTAAPTWSQLSYVHPAVLP